MFKKVVLVAAICMALPPKETIAQTVLPNFTTIQEDYVDAVEEIAKNEIGHLNCNAGNALDWKGFQWLGTKPESVSSIKDFKFSLKFDGGKFSRENLIYVDQITGGTQKQFNDRITRLVTQDNITDYVTEANNLLPSISSIVTGAFTRELEKGHRVHTWRDCDWRNKHCTWNNIGIPNNSTGNKNCNDRSSKLPGTLLDWCGGRYGIFRVSIFTRRQLILVKLAEKQAK